MRAIITIALSTVLLGTAFADRLVNIPLGRKVPFRAIKVTYAFDGAERSAAQGRIGYGIAEVFDFEITTEKFPGADRATSFDLSYNINDPVVNIGPGLSFGIQDVLDETRDRRNVYAAVTWNEGMLGERNQNTHGATTIGFGYRQGRGFKPFVGVAFPFTDQVLFLAEHDSIRGTGGLEIRPIRGGSVRWLGQTSGSSRWELGFLKRF